ncbi:MAG TPA: VOC family protein [Pirellulales bacterium]|jgi:catechol 2,3-dioxygenase-like lactoylglutathione lyase family enzyme|nr:VOC family protein [Pirellulales bacterium]
MPQPLPIRSLHHVARVTKHLEASRAFYRDVLGFRELPRPTLGFPGAWLFNYGIQIHLIVNDAPQNPRDLIETRDNHLAFYLDDVDMVERLLDEHQVPYRVNLQKETNIKQIFFRDPDGHHLEVARYPQLS